MHRPGADIDARHIARRGVGHTDSLQYLRNDPILPRGRIVWDHPCLNPRHVNPIAPNRQARQIAFGPDVTVHAPNTRQHFSRLGIPTIGIGQSVANAADENDIEARAPEKPELSVSKNRHSEKAGDELAKHEDIPRPYRSQFTSGPFLQPEVARHHRQVNYGARGHGGPHLAFAFKKCMQARLGEPVVISTLERLERTRPVLPIPKCMNARGLMDAQRCKSVACRSNCHRKATLVSPILWPPPQPCSRRSLPRRG